MRVQRLMFAIGALTLLCAIAGAPRARAQGYPAKLVKFVMPSAPGSAPDRVSRLLADRLAAAWGVPVVVENRVGGTGTVGSEYVARSAPDGYTALFAFTSVIQAPALLPKVSYDIERDFQAVSLVARTPIVLVVRADSPFRTLADHVNAARSGLPISYGTFGNGSSYHIYGETFRRAANIDLIHVPYKGEALALTDLLGGQISSSFGSVGLTSPHIRAGKVRALGVVAPARSPALPDVPTFAEQGYPRLDVVGWFGVLVPAATPRALVEKLSADINRVMAREDVAGPLRDSGIEPVGTTPDRYAEILRADTLKWRQMILETGIKAD
jgi:tripartite-type tricarboxylate transporter receptor subunit TctC